MKKLTLALSAASLALLGAIGAGPALAQDRPDGGGMGMGDDHAMTWAEFKAHADDGFAKMDGNRDGVIDKSDRQAMRDQMMRNRPAVPDGAVTPPAGGVGGDHPGGPPPGAGMGRGMGRGMGGGMGGMMMMLRGADTDHDGKITRAEYDASVKMHFDAMDTNHDGQISREERQAARAKMRAEMEARMRERGGGDRGGDMGGMHQGPDHSPDHGSEGDDMPPPPQ